MMKINFAPHIGNRQSGGHVRSSARGCRGFFSLGGGSRSSLFKVFIYYHHDGDDASLHGWWFGPDTMEFGTSQNWAFNPEAWSFEDGLVEVIRVVTAATLELEHYDRVGSCENRNRSLYCHSWHATMHRTR